MANKDNVFKLALRTDAQMRALLLTGGRIRFMPENIPLDYSPSQKKPRQSASTWVIKFIAGCVAIISFGFALIWGFFAVVGGDEKFAIYAVLCGLLGILCFFIPWSKISN